MESSSPLCELCARPASLHCASDDAFLCSHCDAHVHRANFLVASHVRQLLCSLCNALSSDFFSGSDRALRPLCASCSPDSCEDDDSLSSFSSSASGSNKNSSKLSKVVGSYSGSVTDEDSGSPARAKRRFRSRSRSRALDEDVEGVFVNWGRKLGVDGNAVASSACLAVGRVAVMPTRVALAGAFWYGLKSSGFRGESTWRQLSRLEEVSGVPAKQILAVQTKLGRALRLDLKEGSDEC